MQKSEATDNTNVQPLDLQKLTNSFLNITEDGIS